jgi:hypothetical protein
MRVGTDPFRALHGDYGDRLLILNAADAPSGQHGSIDGSCFVGRVDAGARRLGRPVSVRRDVRTRPAARREQSASARSYGR